MNPLLVQRTEGGIVTTVFHTDYKDGRFWIWALRISSDDGITFDFTLFDPDQWNTSPTNVHFVNVLGEDITQLSQSNKDHASLSQSNDTKDTTLTLIANHRAFTPAQNANVLVAEITLPTSPMVRIELNKAIFA